MEDKMAEQIIFVEKVQTEKDDIINYRLYDEFPGFWEQRAKLMHTENTLFLGKYSDFLNMANFVLKSELIKEKELIKEMLQLNLNDL